MSTPATETPAAAPSGYYAAPPPSATAVPIFDLESYRQVPGYAEQTTDRVGAWSEGPCDCCRHSIVPNCCMASLCPCVALAQVLVRIGCTEAFGAIVFSAAFTWLFVAGFVVLTVIPIKNDDEPEPTRHLNMLPLALATLWFCVGFVVYIARRKVRLTFKIKEQEYCEDVVLSFLCPPCTLAQIATHAQSYTPRSCSFGRPDTLPPFQDY